jgi:hypothetical protein
VSDGEYLHSFLPIVRDDHHEQREPSATFVGALHNLRISCGVARCLLPNEAIQQGPATNEALKLSSVAFRKTEKMLGTQSGE